MIEYHSDYLDPWTGEYFSDEQEETDEDTCNPGLSD